MSIIKNLSERIHYYYDSFKAPKLTVKIERFLLDKEQNFFNIHYRIGRQMLLNKETLSQFEKKYFEKVSNYDQHRLTKFSTLQHLLQSSFNEDHLKKEDFINFIIEQIKNEQLF